MTRRSWTAVTLVVALVAVGAFVLGRSSAPSQDGPHRSAATTSTTVTSTTADLLPEEVVLHRALQPFTGPWHWHGMDVSIDVDGHGTAAWRIYQWCADDPTPPCDRTEGNLIIDGGAATFVLVHADATSADGYVLATSEPGRVPTGPLHVELRPGDHLFFPGLSDDSHVLCGPNVNPLHRDCGA